MLILSRACGTPQVERLRQALLERRANVSVHPPAGLGVALLGDEAPDVIVTRLPSGTPASEIDTLEACWSGPVLNGPDALRRSHDKSLAAARLRAAGLDTVPGLLVCRHTPEKALAIPDSWGPWLVVKPCTGASGHGVVPRVERTEALRRARAFADLCGRALLQPWLGSGRDRRVLIVGGRAVAAMERLPRGPGQRGNAARGASVRSWQPGSPALTLATRAAAALDLDVAGVDLLADGDRERILEVNACPGLTAIEACTGRDVAGAIARLTLQRAAGV